MKTAIKFLYLFVLLITFFVLYNSIFTVSEGHQALVLRLGKLQKNSQGQPNVMLPGLHF